MSAWRGLHACALGLFAAGLLAQATQPPASPSPGVAPAAPKSARRAPRRPAGPPDTYHLTDGDRVTGHTSSQDRRRFVVVTPYGTLRLPREALERIVRGDGREEILRPAATPSPSPPAPPPAPLLRVSVGGATFWQAWDRRDTIDPTLRLVLTLDGRELAAYVDETLDPQDLPGATVNTFSFDAGQVRITPAAEVSAAVPEVRPGQVVLRLALPERDAAAPELRRLGLAYQVNAGTRETPTWRDAATAEVELPLRSGATAEVELRQDAGRMEFSGFSRKRMKHVESFRLTARARLDTPTPQP